MAKEKIEVMVTGGKATAAPPLGPALGPLKVNIGQVVADINAKTKELAGMQVPVEVEVDTETKEFTIKIGTPPASALIKQKANIKKGAGNPLTEKVANMLMEQIISIAKTKADSLTGKDLKNKVKEICGTCDSMGVMVEGKQARETIKDINEGKFDKEIGSGKTTISEEERKELKEEREELKEEREEKKEEIIEQARSIIGDNKGLMAYEVEKLLEEAKIPEHIIKDLLPTDPKATV